MRRMGWALLVAASLVLAACGSDHPVTTSTTTGAPPTTSSPTTRPRPTTTTSPTTLAPTTTTAPDPEVVPAVITPAYVDAVFAVLNHVYGNATRLMVSSTNIPPAAASDLRAIFADSEYATQLKAFSLTLASGFSNAKKPPGDRVTQVVRILHESSTCLYVQTHTSFAAVLLKPQPQTGPEFYGLEIKPAGVDPTGLNPSPWVIFFNESFPHPSPSPADPCGN